MASKIFRCVIKIKEECLGSIVMKRYIQVLVRGLKLVKLDVLLSDKGKYTHTEKEC